METKHTPGPWVEGQDGNNRVYGPDGMGEHSGLIAVVYKGRANVSLIAAAPDLYEASAELMAALDEQGGNPLRGPIYEARVALRAAIAKAEGR
jgi:hypothetical protein